MSSATDITFPRDTNHEPIPVLAHDFGNVVGGCVMLAGGTYGLSADAIYRIVGNTDLYFAYGRATVAALCSLFGLNAARLPANTIEYFWMKTGHTVLSVVSEYANGGCFNVIRMR